MNNRFHKVIFSQSQQQFVVVSELARSSGKSPALPKAKVDDVFSLLFDNIFSNSELHLQSQTWQNNQLQAGKLVTNSANGKLLLDATNVKANCWEGEGKLWAKENINLDVAVSTSGQHSQEKRKGAEFNLGKGSVGAYTENRLGNGESRTEHASVLSFGGNVSLNAQGGNATLKGTQVVAEGNVSVDAGKDVRITTATTRTTTDDNQAKHGVGEMVISETERFNGYNRQLSSENGEQVQHQQALIASLNQSVEINAGNNVHSTMRSNVGKKPHRCQRRSGNI